MTDNNATPRYVIRYPKQLAVMVSNAQYDQVEADALDTGVSKAYVVRDALECRDYFLSIDAATRKRIDMLAADEGCSPAEAVRRLINFSLRHIAAAENGTRMPREIAVNL